MTHVRVLTTLGILALATSALAQTPPAARPFPADSKLAYVDMNRIAAESTEGKAARAKLTQFQDAKKADLQKKQEALQATQQKLTATGTVLSDAARAQLQKDADRLDRELQRAQQDAQEDLTAMNRDLLAEFQRKLMPLINTVAAEKGLHGVFSLADAGLVWYDPSLDITNDVLKRMAAASPAPSTAAAPPATQPKPTAPAAPKKP